MVSQYILVYSKAVKAIIKEIIRDIRQKEKICYFITHKGGGDRGVNLAGYIDSPHMVFQYLLIHSKAVKALINEI